jgi:hypothetical protein
MGKAYATFAEEEHAERKIVYELNTEITENHMQQKLVEAELNTAILNNDAKAEEAAEAKVATLKKELAKLERRVAVKTQGGARTGIIVDAGNAVLEENNVEIRTELQPAHDKIVARLNALRTEFMEGVAELGLLAKRGHSLRAQMNHVAGIIGATAPWAALPDEAINHMRQRGAIYWDNKIMKQIFDKGR